MLIYFAIGGLLLFALPYLGTAIALWALARAHAGPWHRNPALWLAFLALPAMLAAASGRFRDAAQMPPPIAFVVLAGLVWTALALRYGQVRPGTHGLRALLAVSLARIPVELMLHTLAGQGRVPVMMTWNGTNLDILSGLGAAALLALNFKGRLSPRMVQVWNWFGLALLLNVLVTGILSAPSPVQQLNFGQPNRAVLDFPYVLLISTIVPAVLYTHLRLLRWRD